MSVTFGLSLLHASSAAETVDCDAGLMETATCAGFTGTIDTMECSDPCVNEMIRCAHSAALGLDANTVAVLGTLGSYCSREAAVCDAASIPTLCADFTGMISPSDQTYHQQCSDPCVNALIPCAHSAVLGLDGSTASVLDTLGSYCSRGGQGEEACVLRARDATFLMGESPAG